MTRSAETIVEHLIELRKRIIYVLIFLSLSFCLSFIWAGNLYQFLTSQFDQKLVVLGPNDILWIYMSLAGLMAFGVSLPFLTYQIWAYIAPALTKKERKLVWLYVPSVFICFLAGLAFGFFVVSPNLLQVLLSLGDGLFETTMTAQNYMAFVLHTTLPLAVLFELPVMIAFLTSLGLVTSSWLKKYRRYAYFTLIVLAVVLTPADLFSDLMLSIPLLLIYEVSIIVSRTIERQKGEKNGNS